MFEAGWARAGSCSPSPRGRCRWHARQLSRTCSRAGRAASRSLGLPVPGPLRARPLRGHGRSRAGGSPAGLQRSRIRSRARGAAEDLTSPVVQSRLGSAMARGEVAGAVLGPPCGAWGAAADQGVHGPTRSVQEPRGLTDRVLTARQPERLRRGNHVQHSPTRRHKREIHLQQLALILASSTTEHGWGE